MTGEPSWENRQAAFVARVTAGTTHEFRNIFAIIKESAGLIEDLLALAESKQPPDRERFLRAVDRIRAQVARGADLVTALNRFAHTLDRPEGRRRLRDDLSGVVLLSQRIARRRRQRLVLQEGAEDAETSCDALEVQMLFFLAVECCLGVLPDDGTVTIDIAGGRDATVVRLRGTTEGPAPTRPIDGADGWTQLQQLAEGLRISLTALKDGWGLSLALPARERVGGPGT